MSAGTIVPPPFGRGGNIRGSDVSMQFHRFWDISMLIVMFSTRVSRLEILLCILLGCFLGTAIYMYQNAAKTRYSLVDCRADIHIGRSILLLLLR